MSPSPFYKASIRLLPTWDREIIKIRSEIIPEVNIKILKETNKHSKTQRGLYEIARMAQHKEAYSWKAAQKQNEVFWLSQ